MLAAVPQRVQGGSNRRVRTARRGTRSCHTPGETILIPDFGVRLRFNPLARFLDSRHPAAMRHANGDVRVLPPGPSQIGDIATRLGI